jgi:hypothetical protein
MLFYSKELQSSAQDGGGAHNPFVIGKLDMRSISNFNFDNFQGYIDANSEENPAPGDVDAARQLKVNRKNFGRYFPRLKEHSFLVSIPDMLILSCNIIEMLRLRSSLIRTLEQVCVLRDLYQR